MKKVRLTKSNVIYPIRKRWLYEDITTTQPSERFFMVKGKKVRLCDIKQSYSRQKMSKVL
jgi:hypothetical protein